jgi:Na+/H+ antiporter NhaD/arsenite permease-like protein
VGIVIFGLTYVLISARRLQLLGLDRPAAAVLGAVACVGVGLLSPEEALGAIDGATLLLLFGVMGMGAFLAVDGFFDQIEGRLLLVARTPSRLLGLTVWGAGILSALITNDAVCVLGAPLVVRMIKNRGLPPLPFLLALATGANTGSVATLVGNPQNMLCGLLGDLSYRDHLLLMAPVAALGLAINHLLLWWPNRRELSSIRLRPPSKAAPISPRAKVTLAVIGATSVGYVLGADLAWTSAGGFIVLMLLHRRDTRELWPRIDWSLLVFFGGLFVVVGGLMKSGLPDAVFERFPLSAHGDGFAGWTRLAGIFLVGSNVVSNVPFILVVRDQMSSISDPTLAWELLAMASTFAGNLTLLGSVANVIVAESAREIGGFGFWQHLRVGLPLSLLTTALGTVWVVWSGIGT